jgi:hypothetical protein
MLIACERERGVEAGGEEGRPETYQPRPAPGAETGETAATPEVQGELLRVDRSANTISVRAENGMEQTFKVDDQTRIEGLQTQPQTKSQAMPVIRSLAGKEGSHLTVEWKEVGGAKTATNIKVMHISSGEKNKTGRNGLG